MADYATALRDRLLADPTVGGLVGVKVFWTIVPQGTAFSYIRLQTISDLRPQHLKGYNEARLTRVQCDCFAGSEAAARVMAEAVITCVALPTTIGEIVFGRTVASGPVPLGEDVEGVGYVHRMSVDLIVDHRAVSGEVIVPPPTNPTADSTLWTADTTELTADMA